MNILKLLERLKGERESFERAIALIETFSSNGTRAAKRKSIIKAVKKRKKQKHYLHWTQRPENRAKVMKQMRKAARASQRARS
jgi:hypothetical protein